MSVFFFSFCLRNFGAKRENTLTRNCDERRRCTVDGNEMIDAHILCLVRHLLGAGHTWILGWRNPNHWLRILFWPKTGNFILGVGNLSPRQFTLVKLVGSKVANLHAKNTESEKMFYWAENRKVNGTRPKSIDRRTKRNPHTIECMHS